MSHRVKLYFLYTLSLSCIINTHTIMSSMFSPTSVHFSLKSSRISFSNCKRLSVNNHVQIIRIFTLSLFFFFFLLPVPPLNCGFSTSFFSPPLETLLYLMPAMTERKRGKKRGIFQALASADRYHMIQQQLTSSEGQIIKRGQLKRR